MFIFPDREHLVSNCNRALFFRIRWRHVIAMWLLFSRATATTTAKTVMFLAIWVKPILIEICLAGGTAAAIAYVMRIMFTFSSLATVGLIADTKRCESHRMTIVCRANEFYIILVVVQNAVVLKNVPFYSFIVALLILPCAWQSDPKWVARSTNVIL